MWWDRDWSEILKNCFPATYSLHLGPIFYRFHSLPKRHHGLGPRVQVATPFYTPLSPKLSQLPGSWLFCANALRGLHNGRITLWPIFGASPSLSDMGLYLLSHQWWPRFYCLGCSFCYNVSHDSIVSCAPYFIWPEAYSWRSFVSVFWCSPGVFRTPPCGVHVLVLCSFSSLAE